MARSRQEVRESTSLNDGVASGAFRMTFNRVTHDQEEGD